MRRAILKRLRTLPMLGVDFDHDPQGADRDFLVPLYVGDAPYDKLCSD